MSCLLASVHAAQQVMQSGDSMPLVMPGHECCVRHLNFGRETVLGLNGKCIMHLCVHMVS